jgi:acetyltransferase-like isoleucine patch superfamily enzyme
MSADDLLRLGRVMVSEIRDRIARSRDPVAFARSKGVTIGERCRLIDCDFGSEPYLVTLGDHVSATSTSFVTHDGGVWVFRDEWPEADVFGPITVGSNVFLGAGVMVLPGVTVGSDVVVGARSVVSRDLPSGCVAVGSPATPIRSLDEYRTSLERRRVPTKRLEPAAKREYLLRHLGRA